MADSALEGPLETLVEPLPLRFFGDQVLRRVATPITEIDGDIAELANRMLATMAEAEGVGLAAPQVGRTVRMFTHALQDEAPMVLINPEIIEVRGEWVYKEGCLSIPGLYYELVRPGEVHLRAWSLQGEELSIECDDLLARVLQHELDHLDGILMVDRLIGQARIEAEIELRQRVAGTLGASDPFLTGRRISRLKGQGKT